MVHVLVIPNPTMESYISGVHFRILFVAIAALGAAADVHINKTALVPKDMHF